MTALVLAEGAQLQTNNPDAYVSMEAFGASLLGSMSDLRDVMSPPSNIKATGTQSQAPLRIATTHNIAGLAVRGITVDQNQQSINGVVIGGSSGAGSLIWSTFADFNIVQAPPNGNALMVNGSWQNSRCDRCCFYRYTTHSNYRPSSGSAVTISASSTSGTSTVLKFVGGRIQGFTNGFLLGDANSSNCPSDIHIAEIYFDGLATDGGAAVNAACAYHLLVRGDTFQGPNRLGAGTERGIILGTSNGKQATNAVISGNLGGLFDVFIEGFSWRGGAMYDNVYTYAQSSGGPTPVFFLNTGNKGGQRSGLDSYSNSIFGLGLEISDSTGFQPASGHGVGLAGIGDRALCAHADGTIYACGARR
jgi:hypothetical protein